MNEVEKFNFYYGRPWNSPEWLHIFKEQQYLINLCYAC